MSIGSLSASAEDICYGTKDPNNYTMVCATETPGGGHDRGWFGCVETYETDGYNVDYERVCALSYSEEDVCVIGGKNYHGNPGDYTESHGCMIGGDGTTQ